MEHTALKALILKVLGSRPLNAEAICFRAGLVVNRPNMKAVRLALQDLRRERAITSQLCHVGQDIVYFRIPAPKSECPVFEKA